MPADVVDIWARYDPSGATLRVDLMSVQVESSLFHKRQSVLRADRDGSTAIPAEPNFNEGSDPRRLGVAEQP